MSEQASGSASPNGEEPTIESLKEQITTLVSERDALKTKARTLENAAKSVKELTAERDQLLVDKSTIHADFENFKKQVKDKEVDQHVSTALEAANARNPATVRKLLDMSKLEFGDGGQVVQESLAKMIEAVKTSDPYLFGEKEEAPAKKQESSSPTTNGGSAPTVKPVAGNSARGDAYTAALQEAVRSGNMNALQDTLKKFGLNA